NYPAKTLHQTISYRVEGKDMSNNDIVTKKTITYKDKFGRIICEKQMIKSKPKNSYSFSSDGTVQWTGSGLEVFISTYYVYDQAGNLIKVIAPDNETVTYTYNSLGQKLSQQT